MNKTEIKHRDKGVRSLQIQKAHKEQKDKWAKLQHMSP